MDNDIKTIAGSSELPATSTDPEAALFAMAFEGLEWDDRLMLALQGMYSRAGFSRFRVDKFEPYDLYQEYRGFLRNDAVITFTDLSGRLMAMKPDVTLSIVKSVPADAPALRVYYLEKVFRVNPANGEFGEISQVGIECLACEDAAQRIRTQTEVLGLALDSLDLIGPNSLLMLSHRALVEALLGACTEDESARSELYEALTARNLIAFDELLSQTGASLETRELVSAAVRVAGPLAEAVEELEILGAAALCPDAIAELRELAAQLEEVRGDCGAIDKVCLDFTLTGQTDYYNGLEFQGYIEGLPRAVLSGGRYDELVRRFGKPQGAIGFAVYLGEIARAFMKAEIAMPSSNETEVE